jgi:hypothetical protein
MPASPGELAKLATSVASLVEEYKRLDAEIAVTTSGLVDDYAALEEKANTNLKPLVVRMWSLLSQRGALRKRLTHGGLPPEVSVQLLALTKDLPGWVEWYEGYRARITNVVSLRTFQRDLAKINQTALEDGAAETDPKAKTAGEDTQHTGSENNDNAKGASNEKTDEKQDERLEIKTGPELLTEHATRMLDALTGRSLKNDAMRISRTVELVKDMQQSIDQGKLFPPALSVASEAISERLDSPQPPTLEPPAKLDEESSEIGRLAVKISGTIVEIAPALEKIKSDGRHPGATVVKNAKRILSHWQKLHSEKQHQSSTDASTNTDSKDAPARKTKPKATTAPELVTPNTTEGHASTDNVRKPAKSITVDGRTVRPGFNCKHNSVPCEITGVFDGDDPAVSLIRQGDGAPVGAGTISVRELRYIADPEEFRGS